MENFEVIVGHKATLRLSPGTARLLYRGVLVLTALDRRSELPESARNYIERRRAMLGCQPAPIDLRDLGPTFLDGNAQRTLANLVRRIAMNAARAGSAELGIHPDVRLRFVAALIEVYCLLCANLPIDFTLPPPVGLALTREEWRLVELERLRIRTESESGESIPQFGRRALPVLPDGARRDEIVHRQISVFAG